MSARGWALALLLLLLPAQSWAVFARVTSASGADESGSSGTTITVQLTGVSANNVIVCWVKHEGASSVTITVGDGTSSFTSRPIIHSTTADTTHGQFFYLLASVATGTVTYTATFSVGVPYRTIGCYELSVGGSGAAFDTSNGSGADSGGGNTITSDTVTTSVATAVAFGGYAEYSSAAFSSPLVNGVAADHTQNVGTFGRMWMRVLSATFSGGAATATLPSGNIAATGIIVLSESGGGGGGDPTFGFSRRRMQ
jgi:hypothetical protein